MMNYSSPMANYYRNQMGNIANGYNYIPPYPNTSPMPVQPPVNDYPCRPVTSIDEARAAMINDPIKPHIYTDFGNKKMYVKYIDNSGNARFAVFAEQPENITPQNEVKNVDISSIQAEIEHKFKEKIDNLEENIKILNQEIIRLKGGLNNDTEPSKPSSNSKSSK